MDTDQTLTMQGDANGYLNLPGGFFINWDTVADNVHRGGEWFCDPFGLCADLPPTTPPNPPTPIDALNDEPIGDLLIDFGANPDVEMSWVLTDPNSGPVTVTLHVVGHETGRQPFEPAPPVVPSLSPLGMGLLWSLLGLSGWRRLRT